ncbi:hypothetical protein JMJ55_15600 [Belnapia sp. T6]|uniref:Uncharacterized protein n=1 Tax=Belnapia mucosa TaxID=2804532 RepID=A0ABS1V4Z8_9PROT|nr:hypothetical protein [Belnapia mucosa]MBL6456761.1 hypothetical protein [Belnapia mucosa]
MRAWALPLLLLGWTTAALAEEAVVTPEPPAAAAPAPAAPPRPAPPRRPRVPAVPKPPPLDLAKQAPRPQAPRIPPMVGSQAPVPNRDLDPRQVLPQERTSLGPSLLYRNLPGRGLAAEGAPNLLEDKLYKPAPGARLTVPFAY